jgi:diguanylate cyclase (GGDEF)-like protein/PAS domain S-box-containing protein
VDLELQLLRRLVDASPVPVALVDARDAGQPVVYVNPGFEALTGYAAADLVGRNLRLLQGEHRDQEALQRLREALARGEACEATVRNLRRDGVEFRNEFSVVPLRDADGAVSHFAAYYRQPRLQRDTPPAPPVTVPGIALLREDRLSGLLTRQYIEELLKRDWAIAQRERHSVTVFAIDIDALELYNATFGRGAGDSVIRRVGHCIMGCLRRASDAAARLEGGRFLAFASGLSEDQALQLGRTVAERVRELHIHHPRCAVLRYISVSVGVASAVPAQSQAWDALVGQAGERLQSAKEAGRNTVR